MLDREGGGVASLSCGALKLPELQNRRMSLMVDYVYPVYGRIGPHSPRGARAFKAARGPHRKSLNERIRSSRRERAAAGTLGGKKGREQGRQIVAVGSRSFWHGARARKHRMIRIEGTGYGVRGLGMRIKRKFGHNVENVPAKRPRCSRRIGL